MGDAMKISSMASRRRRQSSDRRTIPGTEFRSAGPRARPQAVLSPPFVPKTLGGLWQASLINQPNVTAISHHHLHILPAHFRWFQPYYSMSCIYLGRVEKESLARVNCAFSCT